MTEPIETIFKNYLAGKCTDEEIERLFLYIKQPENESLLKQAILDELKAEPVIQPETEAIDRHLDVLYQNIHQTIDRQKHATVRSIGGWRRVAVAAAVVACIAGGSYLWWNKRLTDRPATGIAMANDIRPGAEKATLTLSNGQQIALTDAHTGQIAQQDKTLIHKTADGKITYTAPAAATGSEIIYNTITTPRAGQYKVVLSDGTLVTLDAASSIKYPVRFTGKERKVEITGQAYFEVVHNAANPFRVTTGALTVEDIGTQFNIKAYGDEPAIKTTLIQGSVKVSTSGSEAVLNPGEGTELSGSTLTKKAANIDEAIAWKDGYFRFYDESLQGVMRQISRWYDVDIRYQGTQTNDGFNGKISRNKNISQILQMLESTRLVHFTVQGKLITVMP